MSMKEFFAQSTTNEISMYITFILFVASIIFAIVFGYIPQKRNKEIKSLKGKLKDREIELLAVYQDVQALIQIEDCLCKETDISKKRARELFTVSYRCEPKRVEKRIIELQRLHQI